MLSTKECVEILNDESETPMFSAEEATQLRDFLIELSEIAFSAYSKENDTNDTREFKRKESNRLRSG